jgi:hypothetical protein
MTVIIEGGKHPVTATRLDAVGPCKKREGVVYEAHYEMLGEKLRVNIYADFYDFQSHARIHIYRPSDKCWQVLASLPYANMKSEKDPRSENNMPGYVDDEREPSRRTT